MKSSSLFFTGILLWLSPILPMAGVQTEKFLNDTFSDFVEGEVRGVAITSDGFLKLGPTVSRWSDLPASIVWNVVRSPDGITYVAAGNEGRVYKVDSKGKASEFFKAAELQVQALTLDPEGNLFAASLPEGKIYRVTPEGESSIYFDPKEKYIWALQWDDRGNLFAATGDKGRLFKVTGPGKGAVFYDSDETHLRTLCLDNQKRLWAGSDGNGLVFRFDKTSGAQGVPFVAYDSHFREIKALLPAAEGAIFVAAMGDGKSTSSLPSIPPARRIENPASGAGARGSSIAGTTDPAPKAEEISPSPVADKPGAGEIVRIAPDGMMEKWWQEGDDIFTLAQPTPGRLWAGTGRKGRLIEITGPRQWSLLGQIQGETITALLPRGDGTWIAATSTPGALWTLSMNPSRKGSFESRVLDTHTSSYWGAISLRTLTGPGKITITSRTGNTSKPDKAWDEWKPLDKGGRVTSPVGRFFQYRLELEKGGDEGFPAVDSVALYYRPANQPPRISRVTVLAPDIELVKTPRVDQPLPPILPGGGSHPGTSRNTSRPEAEGGENPAASAMRGSGALQQVKHSGWRSLLWQVGDPNGDTLRYSVQYRKAGNATWQMMKENLSDMFYAWDAGTWPDGEYYAKVMASDLPSNLGDEARGDEWISDLFVVDNTPPEINTGEDRIKSGLMALVIHDEISVVDEAEYSLDGADWRPLLPLSGIYDSKSNTFEIPLSGLASGEHYVVIRASDSANNVATKTIHFKK